MALDFSAMDKAAYRGCKTDEDKAQRDALIAQGATIIEDEPLPFDEDPADQAKAGAEAMGPNGPIEVRQLFLPHDIPAFCELYRAGRIQLVAPLIYDKTGRTGTLYAHFRYLPKAHAST